MPADLPWPGFGPRTRRPSENLHPFREFILKVQSRCNLDCDYCYVYHLADQSWRNQPRRMTPHVVAATADRIAEHARAHDLDSVTVRLHGGEPLLGGPGYVVRIVETLRDRIAPIRVVTSIQTNGVLLDAETADRLIAADIGVGISLDGDRTANDLHRRFRDGRSSYDAVSAAIAVMREPARSAFFSGVLSTVQLEADPLRVWRGLLDLDVPALDFLLPHGTWQNPPPGLIPDDRSTPYADWLIPIFDQWFDAPERPCRVRIFEDLVHLVLGGTQSYESFGLNPVTLVVIETDGSYEQVDSMKAVHEGAAATGLDVVRHSLDEVLQLPAFVARQLGFDALSHTCRACVHRRICGGGLYPHRYRPGSGFRNPSVYCADLFAVITHIERRVADGLAERGTSLGAIRAERAG
ncbi:FxsB family cyclophane-forming radical SAM/SPASM peptide maturase [Nocardia pneumoniae]|uniref:FxsB family cyclophane-forming radical SAM/SPASM peptide maturase n=1 Tax=Nocardia pneumoniae TaxID=228601 RepID=UPI000318B87B|nr:FxsB family cyclophane-forming radical SAM/SPASM peptide maturase [Nocardia pneumoniae]